MLETILVETGPKPTAAVIWLHGLGADGHDFEPIVPELVRSGERAWRFVFPHAPVRPVTINNGMRMRAWYDIKGFERGSQEDLAGFKQSEAEVHELIERELKAGISAERIVLAGFSQGGAVSLYMLPRLQHRIAGVIALSCYLPAQQTLTSERVSDNDATPIFMAHGQADPVVPLQLGASSKEVLLKAGFRVEWHEYPMPHSVCPAEIGDIREFLFRVLT